MPTNATTVERFLMAWTTGDIERALSLSHPDMHFKGPIEEWQTAKQHLDALRPVAGIVERVDLHRTVASGDDVVVIYDLVTTTDVGRARIAEWMTLRDGKIADIRAYFDSHPWRTAGFGGR
jgi:ketosteroid isomerase-like protein